MGGDLGHGQVIQERLALFKGVVPSLVCLRMKTQLALARCPNYEAVGPAMERLIGLLGSVGTFVKSGQSVLIKPNLLTDRTPADAVTTHPEVVRAVIRLVRTAGGKPWVGDSPGNAAKLQRVWERTGMEAVCRAEDVPLVNLEKGGMEECVERGFRFLISKAVLAADAIINVPKVKTHILTGLTGGVKNLYGTVPGFQKIVLHRTYPRRDEFVDLLVAVYGRVKPVLSIADGVVGMEGNGPSGGTPVRLGFLAASNDAVALDVALSRLLGLEFNDVATLAAAQRCHAGETDWNRIVVVGDDLDMLKPPRVCHANTVPTHSIPVWISRLLLSFLWHRPVFLQKCVFCGLCVRSCPAGALAQASGQKPILRSSRCIECCCCHEMCPEGAIAMVPSPLFRLVKRLRGHR